MLLIKFGSCDVYRAIYLEELTVKELVDKLVQCMEIKRPVSKIVRFISSKDNTKPKLVVEVNDDVVKDMLEAQPMFIEAEDVKDGSVKLVLSF